MVGKLSSLERIDRQATLHVVTIEEIHVEINESSPLRPYISSLSLAKKNQRSQVPWDPSGSLISHPMLLREGFSFNVGIGQSFLTLYRRGNCLVLTVPSWVSHSAVSLDKHALLGNLNFGGEMEIWTNNSKDLLLTENLLEMSTPNAESLLRFQRLRFQDIKDMPAIFLCQELSKKLTSQCRICTDEDLKRKDAYSRYSNPRVSIYQNKDKKNRLMRINELHKFSDGTLNDVWTAHDDRLKEIRMKYLP
ncbi:hypothetical protein Tco_0735525 [Tanacetum coccineum]